MTLDLTSVTQSLIDEVVPRPPGVGAISGHAAGEPFDKLVTKSVRLAFPGRAYRQFELLNQVFESSPQAITPEERIALLGPPALAALLKRGREATLNWRSNRPFKEKQDDTADIVVLPSAAVDLHTGPVHLVDVKTYNAALKGRPPNIISAGKLAEMCKLMIDSDNYGSHDFSYLSVEWSLSDSGLKVERASTIRLFAMEPQSLYINWAAAMQIQFHPHERCEDFTGPVSQWCRTYLQSFVASAQKRVGAMKRKYVERYADYLYL